MIIHQEQIFRETAHTTMDNLPPGNANPYAPPAAQIEDAAPANDGTFDPRGRKVPAGNVTGWFGAAWENYARRFGSWLGISALYLLLGVLAACIPLGNQVLVCLLTGGFLIGYQRFIETGEIEIGDLFAGFQNHGGPLAIAGLIQAAIYYVFFLPGFVLQLAAGLTHAGPHLIISTTILYYVLAFLGSLALKLTIFAPPLIIFHGMEPWAAIKASFNACFRNAGAFIIFLILSYPLLVAGFLFCLIGLIFVMPLYIPAYYHAYREIFLTAEPAQA